MLMLNGRFAKKCWLFLNYIDYIQKLLILILACLSFTGKSTSLLQKYPFVAYKTILPLCYSLIVGCDYIIAGTDYIIAGTDFIITAIDYRIIAG